MKVLPFLLLVGLALPVIAQMPKIEPGVSHDLAIWRAAHYSDVRYKLNLTLEKMSPVLRGTIEIHVVVEGEKGRKGDGETQAEIRPSGSVSEAVPPIILDWRKLAGHEKDSTITNISLNGGPVILDHLRSSENFTWGLLDMPMQSRNEPLAFEINEHLIFRDGIMRGENVIKLDFTSPILTSGSAITRYIDKEDGSEYLYSLFVPSDASTAFPVFDQPDLKARFTLSVSAPRSWTVISNSPLIDPKSTAIRRKFATDDVVGPVSNPAVFEGLYLSEFSETKPISTYVFAFAAGPWQEFDGGTAGILPAGAAASSRRLSAGSTQDSRQDGGVTPHFFVRKSQAAKFQPYAAEVFKMTGEGVKYLEDYFDFKFPWPKYDLVLIPEFPFGGMEHAGATFLNERGVIFPSEPTANDYISRANLIFHETAHQWFGDTVTMRWFDDLWLKEGFAEFMAYKTLEKTMPQYNAWKAFYERNKPAAYFTDSTRGTTPIYQPIDNLSAAKSAYGNIVYRKAPSFLRQAEFYLGPDKFQTAVRTFLKKHAFANATWQDLVNEFEAASGRDLKEWAAVWVKDPGVAIFRASRSATGNEHVFKLIPEKSPGGFGVWRQKINVITVDVGGLSGSGWIGELSDNPRGLFKTDDQDAVIFPNYQDYGYGIFLLDPQSRDYVLTNIQNEKDDFLRSMMWGSLWDSVREAELDPRQYVELAIKDLPTERDETITASVLNRVSTAMTYYIAEKQKADLIGPLEDTLVEKMTTAKNLGMRMTYFRSLLSIASTEKSATVLKELLEMNAEGTANQVEDAKKDINSKTDGLFGIRIPLLRTKDRFDIVTRLAILGDPDAPKLLAELEKTETSDDAKRYAYAAHAAFATRKNREKFWNDFVNNKDISESWIEAAMGPFNSPKHSDLSLPYLERALAELPNLKRNRKIFFVNGWLGAFLGGQKSQEALDIVNKFLADNPNLDRDLRLKILENMDVIERAVKIRSKYSK